MKITKILIAVFLMASSFIVGCKPKDSDIKASVEEKFKADPNLAALNVDVNDGVATITGQCKDAASMTKCEETAKSVKGVKSVVNNCTMAAAAQPVQVNTDDALNQGVIDATKDFPTVNASVNDGVVTLTGSIKRANLQKLMQSLNTLKPKKVENKLTIQ